MGWYTITNPSQADKYTGVRHTRTGAANMREHRATKRDDAEDRNRMTLDRNRKAVRRVMAGGSLTDEWDRMKQAAGAVAVSEKGIRKRKQRKAEMLAKQMSDLAQAAGEGFEVFSHGGDVFTIQHKTTPIVPEQVTARQMDVYDMLGDL